MGCRALVGLIASVLVTGCNDPHGETPSLASSASASDGLAPASSASASLASAPSASTPLASARSAKPPDTIVAQHILVAYKGSKRTPRGVTRSKTDAKARAEEALAKIQAGMPFEDAVKEYSDDAGSVDRMGLVGKFHRGDMEPAFSAAAFRLQVEQVSELVETPFGYHIIKRTQ